MPRDRKPEPYACPNGKCEPVPRKAGILVAEDDDLVRSVLEVGLRQRGFTVWLAANGREAIEIYHRHHSDIHLVLLDVRMPSLDGPQTWSVLEKLDPNLSCCFMTGDPGRYLEDELLQQGAARVFQKPFKLDEVVETFRSLLNKQRLARAERVGSPSP
jgi:DNA-binding NtrC family response regulator